MLAGKRRVFLPLPMGEGRGEGLPLEALRISKPSFKPQAVQDSRNASFSLSLERPLHYAPRPRRCGPLLLPLPVGEQLCGTSNANGPCRSFSFSLEGEGWDEGGCCLQQPRHIGSNPPPLRRLLLPLPVGEGWGEGSSGQPSLGLRKRLLWERVGVRVARPLSPAPGHTNPPPPRNSSPSVRGRATVCGVKALSDAPLLSLS